MKYLKVLVLLAVTIAAHAQVTYTVTLNTTPLIGHPAGPFSLAFQLADGSGSGDGNNAAVINNVQFGAGGLATGVPRLFGGASGSLTSAIVLVDNGFPNLFTQAFTPGTTLTFQVALSGNSDPQDISDQFIMTVVDNTGAPIPTLFGAPLDVFVAIDLGSPNAMVQTFGNDPTRSPAAGGGPIGNIAAPTIAPLLGACATDVTSQFQVTQGGFRFDNATQQFVQTVTMNSTNPSLASQPVWLMLVGLTPNASLFNKDSNTICVSPLNSPYAGVPIGSMFVLNFVDPTMTGISYGVRVLSGSGIK